MSHVRGYPLIRDALRRAGLSIPPDADPPSKQFRAAERVERPALVLVAGVKLPIEAARFVALSKNGWSKKRVVLWYEQGGLCHWCRCPMILVEPNGKNRLPPNACTIDHLRSRLDPTRREPARNQERRLVAACQRCNSARGSREQRERDARLSKQDLWLRNGNFFGIAKMAGALNEVEESWNVRAARTK